MENKTVAYEFALSLLEYHSSLLQLEKRARSCPKIELEIRPVLEEGYKEICKDLEVLREDPNLSVDVRMHLNVTMLNIKSCLLKNIEEES